MCPWAWSCSFPAVRGTSLALRSASFPPSWRTALHFLLHPAGARTTPPSSHLLTFSVVYSLALSRGTAFTLCPEGTPIGKIRKQCFLELAPLVGSSCSVVFEVPTGSGGGIECPSQPHVWVPQPSAPLILCYLSVTVRTWHRWFSSTLKHCSLFISRTRYSCLLSLCSFLLTFLTLNVGIPNSLEPGLRSLHTHPWDSILFRCFKNFWNRLISLSESSASFM